MRNKKRMLAAGLISVAFLSTVTGCGSASRKVQEPQGIQGTGGTAPNSSTADNTAQAGVSQHATAGSATMVNGGITEWHGRFPERGRHIADNTGRRFHRDSKTDRHGQNPWH